MELFKLFGRIGLQGVDETNRDIDETVDNAEQSEGKFSSAFKKIGAAVATYFAVDKIVSFGKAIVDASAEVSAETSAFQQIMGDYTDEASKKVQKIADATGMVDTRLTPYMTSMTAKFKGLGLNVGDATDKAAEGLNIAADASAFWDKSMEDAMGGLNSFVNGSYEGGEAIGLFANDTQMAAYAVKSGIIESTKAWASLDEATKQATRLDYAKAMMDASGATGQAAKESTQYANVQANLAEKWRQFKAQIGEPLLQNIVIPAMAKLSAAVDKVSAKYEELKPKIEEVKNKLITVGNWISGHQGLFIALAAVIGVVTVAMGLQAVVQGVKAAMNAAEATSLGALIAMKLADAAATMAALLPYILIVAAIAAVIAIIVLCVKHWDEIKAKVTEVAEKIKAKVTEMWEGIKNALSAVGEWFKTTIIDPIVNFFTGLWNSIVAIWNGIKNAISFAFQFIVMIITTYFNLITLPFRFIWENCKDTVMKVFNAIKTFISNAINRIKTVITTVLNAIKRVFTTVWNAIKNFITPIVNAIKNTITKVFNAVKNTISNIFNGIKHVVTTIWNGIKTTISNVVNGIKNTVSKVFNAVKTAIQTPLNAAKNIVSNIFNGIKTTISNVINGAKNIVSKGIQAIKGFFDKLKIKFPNIKLPHFKLSGKFSLDPPSVPKLKIDWYAKAMNNPMLMNSPTIFGYNPATGSMMGGGEAGSEVVSGTNTLMGMIQNAVASQNAALAYYLQQLLAILADYFPQILVAMNRDLVLDTGVLAGQLAPQIDDKLGDISRMRGRGK